MTCTTRSANLYTGLRPTDEVQNLRTSKDGLPNFTLRPPVTPSVHSSSCIRVLSIEPKTPGQRTVRCHFHITDLRNPIPYQALSYAWEAQEFTQLIVLDGKPFLVSPTVERALLRIRRHWDIGALLCNGVRPNLWLDAICINQSDLEEKSEQVSLMGQIFSRAQCVLIWLGEPVQYPIGEEDLVRTIINFDTTRASDKFADHPSYTRSVGLLMLKPWFRRRWVVQETLLQENRWMLFGKLVFSLRRFSATLGPTTSIGCRWMWMPNHRSRSRTLLEYMVLCMNTECSNPLDLIYALRAVSTDGETLAVNYKLDVGQAFVELAFRYVCTGWLPLLLACATMYRSETPGFPTWVPDWRVRGERGDDTGKKDDHLWTILDSYAPYTGPFPELVTANTPAYPTLVLTAWTAKKAEYSDQDSNPYSDLLKYLRLYPNLDLYLYLRVGDHGLVFILKRKKNSRSRNLYELTCCVRCRVGIEAHSIDRLDVNLYGNHNEKVAELRMKTRTVEIF